MTVHYDEKGKFFTEVVSKESLPVIIQTDHNFIRGNYHIPPDARVKDDLNQCEDMFIAVTDAVVYDKDGREEKYRTAFLALNRNEIVWLIPEEDLEGGAPTGDEK